LRNQVEQGGNGATRGEQGDVFAAAGAVEHALQAATRPVKACQVSRPSSWHARRVPALHHQGEQALELAAVLRTVAQHMQRFGLFRQQAGSRARITRRHRIR
jgi:hypothetical protein